MKSNTKSTTSAMAKELVKTYRQASAAMRASVEAELSELDHLASEGLGTEARKTRRSSVGGPR